MDNPNLYLLDLHDLPLHLKIFLGKTQIASSLSPNIYKFQIYAQHKLTLPREETERTSI